MVFLQEFIQTGRLPSLETFIDAIARSFGSDSQKDKPYWSEK